MLLPCVGGKSKPRKLICSGRPVRLTLHHPPQAALLRCGDVKWALWWRQSVGGRSFAYVRLLRGRAPCLPAPLPPLLRAERLARPRQEVHQ